MKTTEKREISLQELKNIEFDLLKEFRSFCEKNNIRYFLAYGTLLGAIRYKGFIPWDDDVDVLVPREDYNRLIKMYEDSGYYRLYSIERNKKFGYPFAKLCDNRTKKVEGNFNNGVDQGVEIDIFPLDYWNDDLEKAKSEVKKLKKNMYWLDIAKLSAHKARTPFRQIVFNCMNVYSRLFGTEFWIKKINKIGCSQNYVRSNFIGNKVWCPYGERDICPAVAFSSSVKVEFEGEMFPAPIGYDTYLTCLYGDYLPEPPKEKQKTHHTFKAYRLTEEEIQENA